MTVTSDIDISKTNGATRQGLRQRAARTGRQLQDAAGELTAKAQQGLGVARERGTELAGTAGTRLRSAGRGAVGEVRRRPVPYGLAAAAGIAAVAVLASPRARNLVVETAGRLWNAVQARRGALKL